MRKLFSILLVLYSFCYSQSSNHIKEASRILNEYSKEIKEKYGLFTIGSGGAMMNDVKELDLHFEGISKITVSEARKLYIDIVEGLIEKVNNDKKARPYLHEYPFTYKNVKIRINFFKSPDFCMANRVDNGFVSSISILQNGFVCYYTYDYTKEEYKRFIKLHKEPYEEALKIVQKGITEKH